MKQELVISLDVCRRCWPKGIKSDAMAVAIHRRTGTVHRLQRWRTELWEVGCGVRMGDVVRLPGRLQAVMWWVGSQAWL